MLNRYFIKISFDGTHYSGWQIQKNSSQTVQQKINEGLSRLLNEKIEVTGCCRTDAGVHALELFAHFDTQKDLLSQRSLGKRHWVYKFNKMLPFDISIDDIRGVKENSNARFDASERVYKYFIHQKRNPFLINRSYYYYSNLDISRMNRAAAILKRFDDFSAFSKVHTHAKTKRCKILSARWKRQGSRLIFEISADRFLRGMVRMIVGTMILIGKHKLTVEEFRKIIESRNSANAGPLAPACGLYLAKVKYPKRIFTV